MEIPLTMQSSDTLLQEVATSNFSCSSRKLQRIHCEYLLWTSGNL